MEAPEKIYLQENTTTDYYEEFWPEWFEARAKDSDIEYTRTDAFIEKAVEWLESINLDCYQIRKGMFSKQLVKDFRKYMEGGEE